MENLGKVDQEGKAEPRPGGLRSIEQAVIEDIHRITNFSLSAHARLALIDATIIEYRVRARKQAAQAPTVQSAPPPAGPASPPCPDCNQPMTASKIGYFCTNGEDCRRNAPPPENLMKPMSYNQSYQSAVLGLKDPGPPPLEPPAPRPADGFHALYYELLFHVGKKYPGETRHETALRYIRQAEQSAPEAEAGGAP